tara:strand:- start:329 stop:1066 length:738 start_codon:yes stop_codon:yes gene_type:complete
MKNNLSKLENEFFEKGFVRLNLQEQHIYKYIELKNKIKKRFKSKFQKNSFENFHKNVSIKNINKIRMDIIKYINSINKLKNDIYLSLQPFIDILLGPDIIIQKSINLGIQMPLDESRALFHKDTPLSSFHEIVLWIPLVDCKKSMCMLMIDKKDQIEAERLLNGKKKDRFDDFVKKKGKLKEIKFGQALIFNTNNYHYIPINKTTKTRWAINIRLKNLFTPYGERNLLDYYELLKISPLSRMYSN